MKLLILFGLLGLALSFVFNYIKKSASRFISQPHQKYPGFLYLETPHAKVMKEIKTGVAVFFMGFLIAVLIFFLMRKLVVLLFMAPLGIYLMMQLLVVLNHVRHTENVLYWYNLDSGEIIFKIKSQRAVKFNMYKDILEVEKVESIQMSRGLSPYFYVLILDGRKVFISYLHENERHYRFFQTLKDNFDIQSRKKLNTFI